MKFRLQMTLFYQRDCRAYGHLDAGHLDAYFSENSGKDAAVAIAFLQGWFRDEAVAKAKFLDMSVFGSLVREGWNITSKKLP